MNLADLKSIATTEMDPRSEVAAAAVAIIEGLRTQLERVRIDAAESKARHIAADNTAHNVEKRFNALWREHQGCAAELADARMGAAGWKARALDMESALAKAREQPAPLPAHNDQEAP